MGSGKTAVGKRLSGRLGWDFFDADPLVEEHMGMSIQEIFEIHGEPGFRKAEEAVVAGLLDEAARSASGAVVSLGGGAVTIPALYERLLKEPLVVLLDEDVDMAHRRAAGGKRPLAGDIEHFRALYSERESIYRSVAKYIVDTRGMGIDQVVDRIVELIHERTGKI
jgi:shikimate kinase